MDEKTIIKLKSIHSDLWRSAEENDRDLFERVVDRLGMIVEQASAQEQAVQADVERPCFVNHAGLPARDNFCWNCGRDLRTA